MIIDFHVHGKITSNYPFDEEKFLLTVNEAKKNGLSSIALTEHCGAYQFISGYEFLNKNYNCIGDYYNVNGIKVFYGMEVTTKQDLDILIIGNSRLVLELREKIMKLITKGEYIDISDLFNLDISRELLIILAHPYRDHDVLPNIDKDIINKIDAIELNSKDLYKFGFNSMKNKISKLSNELNLPIIAGSDTHYFVQVSTAKNLFMKNCNNVREIKEEIKLGNYKMDFSSDLNDRVREAINFKKGICDKY